MKNRNRRSVIDQESALLTGLILVAVGETREVDEWVDLLATIEVVENVTLQKHPMTTGYALEVDKSGPKLPPAK